MSFVTPPRTERRAVSTPIARVPIARRSVLSVLAAVAMLGAMLGLAGCASRAARYVEQNPDIPPHLARAILDHVVVPGMTPEQVRAAWGDPARRRVVELADGRQETQEYRYVEYYGSSGIGVSYAVGSGAGSSFGAGIGYRSYRTREYIVLFKDGVVTSVEEVR